MNSINYIDDCLLKLAELIPHSHVNEGGELVLERLEDKHKELDYVEHIRKVSKLCLVCGGPRKRNKIMRRACRHHWTCVEHDPVVARMLSACRKRKREWPTPIEVAKLEPRSQIDSCVVCSLGKLPQWNHQFRQFCTDVEAVLECFDVME